MKKHESIIKIAKLASLEPSWVSSNPAARFGETQQGWVQRDPARFVRTQPCWVRGNLARRTQPAGFRRDLAGWVPTRPSRLGSTRSSRLGLTRSSRLGSSQPSKVETQGRKERKRKKEGEEEGIGWVRVVR
ncbi:hypothetical protein SLEP1_g41764 [Rubroshorea leprosula]|uniref:Uncharacterized protein n=1 Tax=Rubroshorea leprosula TaxID=152421 RepID=A0AAV5L8G5_9ROSI|nr:hypothetical protein SLEP1_g41764 [Rubroshorea leprosula]